MTGPAGVRTAPVEANGLTFTVDRAGPDDADLVLLLHGFPQTRHTWRAELTALAGAGYRAWAPDQRGYSPGARPDGIDPYRVDHLVADALALADAAGVERFHLVGHDWGGQLAWLTAAGHPDRIRSLAVLSRPHPRAFVEAIAADPAQADRSRHHRSFQRAEATDGLLADGGDRFRRMLGDNGVPAEAVETYLAVLGDRAAMDAAVNWYRAGGGAGLRAAEVPAVTVPTLYVWGDEDSSVGRMAAEGTAAWVAGPYRFVELAGVGHFVTDQAPDAFPPLLLEHLAAADGRPSAAQPVGGAPPPADRS
jgi:pimeloyl-ACP methyl ester carboxylesterase